MAQGAKEFDTLEELHTPDRTLPEVHLQIAETGRLLEEVKQKLWSSRARCTVST